MAGLSFSFTLLLTILLGWGWQLARIEGQSMAPTLANQDRVVLDKLAYRIGEPSRGDIVIFRPPFDPSQIFIKRIVAQPGDTVRIRDGRVYVNETLLDDTYIPADFRGHDYWGPSTLPADYYLVLGDHRNSSFDSRHWGPVHRASILGKVHARWWPLQQAALF